MKEIEIQCDPLGDYSKDELIEMLKQEKEKMSRVRDQVDKLISENNNRCEMWDRRTWDKNLKDIKKITGE